MKKIIWLGNLVRVGSKTPRYMYNKHNNTIEFRTYKDKKELGWLDSDKEVLYLNRDYKNQFKAVKNQIIKDYQPKNIIYYFNLC